MVHSRCLNIEFTWFTDIVMVFACKLILMNDFRGGRFDQTGED